MNKEIKKYIDARIAAILERALDDDTQWDGTDAAHPAYWRGEKAGVLGAVMRINDALDGKVAGKCQPELQKLREKVMELVEEIKADDQIIANHRKVIELIPECSMHGYCLAHAREWVKTIEAKTMRKAAKIAIEQVAGVNQWDYTAGHDAARHKIHDAILSAAIKDLEDNA